MSNQSLTQKLLHLVSDINFIKIENNANRPNIFDIVGRTHTETWHSMFMGWLLDPNSSHNLGDYPLKRFLIALSDPTIFGEGCDLENVARMASIIDFNDAIVYPNQEDKKEYHCSGVGKLDIFIKVEDEERGEKIIIFVEQKVHDKVRPEQCMKYMNYLSRKYPEHQLIPVILAPSDAMSISIEEVTGSPNWYGVNYQLLHDKVLTPVIKHPELNPQVINLLEQYIDVLKIPYNGRKLAVTEEEKELALELYDKHRGAFEAIQSALSDTTDISLIPTISKQSKMTLLFNNNKIEGNSIPELYVSSLEYFVEHKYDIDSILPYETSSKRYLISKDSVHPSKKDFTTPVKYKEYYMEAHKSREQGIKDIAKLAKLLEIQVEIAK
ncbi:PD-(D/E)XK nuclease family protein [Exiguobacterium sp. LL15]|uniref:PD-(D/E)XK nuclease family protein n=1 Tax=Exiguobacterium sp. LL15 TaxID=2950547 RepID=UPI002109520D|nr:PD-(D/E)XK nuclease family protein [Exiguobacterium sp. LL15]MCQ4089431.1 PD-(D/E)XK nuclease family protein [Exiguobacterium sp. LL15]